MTNSRPDPGDARSYEIRVLGHLDDRWSARFDGLGIASGPGRTTVIAANAIDQAALHGLLRQVRDAGLRLVSVTRVDPGAPPPGDPSPAAKPERNDP
jgi:hypothetical protein